MTQIVKQYGDRVQFLNSFSPDKQITLCANDRAAIVSYSPTLTDINACYGDNMSVMFLLPQLFSVSEFCGAREKFTEHQIEETAQLIATNYPWLKVKEVMTFFKQFKLGHYGKFYGSVDPMVIMCALKEFLVFRNKVYAEYEDYKDRCAKEEEARKPHMSFDEWKSMKEAKGEKVNIAAHKENGEISFVQKKSPIEVAYEKAQNLIVNKHGLGMKTLIDMRKLFIDQNGMTPEEFIKKVDNKEL